MLFCCPDDLVTADFITEEEKKLSGTTVIILIAFVFYLAMMIVIGAVYMKKTSSSEDYFLGGRGLNGWVAALSAQASDGSSRSHLFFWIRTDLDRSGTFYRNCPQLGMYFRKTS